MSQLRELTQVPERPGEAASRAYTISARCRPAPRGSGCPLEYSFSNKAPRDALLSIELLGIISVAPGHHLGVLDGGVVPLPLKHDRTDDADPMFNGMRIVDQGRGTRVPTEIGHPLATVPAVEKQRIAEDEVIDNHDMGVASRTPSGEHCPVRALEETAYGIERHLWTHRSDSTRRHRRPPPLSPEHEQLAALPLGPVGERWHRCLEVG